jgi:NitT/TauT family transport system substrate-binding protein
MTGSTVMRLTLYENYRFVLYAPFYAALTTGAYAAEGLDVEMSPSPGAGKAEEALIAGAVDVIWAGPMRVVRHHDDHPDSPLVCFAEIVSRDPFSVLGRTANSGFRLADLAGLRFASVSEVATPWLCLQQDLREAGIDPSRLDRVTDNSMAENLASLREGRLDAVQLFEPLVEEAVTSGVGHLWYQASDRGRTSYTAFVTTRARLAQHGEALRRMVRAIRRTQQWLSAAPAAAIADAVAGYFPAWIGPGWRAQSPVIGDSGCGMRTRYCRRTASTGCSAGWFRAALSAAAFRLRTVSTTRWRCRRSRQRNS